MRLRTPKISQVTLTPNVGLLKPSWFKKKRETIRSDVMEYLEHL